MNKALLYPATISQGIKKEHANRATDLHAQLKSLVSTKPIVVYQDCKCKVSQLIAFCQDDTHPTIKTYNYKLLVLI